MAEWRSLSAFLLTLLDIGIVSYILYRVVLAIRGTRAVHLVRGLAVLVALTALSRWLKLQTTYWLLEKVYLALAVAIPVVFQPELRRALEQVGRGRIFTPPLPFMERGELREVISVLVRAVGTLSRRRMGALIVLERETGLGDVAESGIKMDALLSPELLVNVFMPQTPLHDGAVLLRGNRVVAAGCFLPMAEPQEEMRDLGARHRAALGITEVSDALAVVVSEETGAISLAHGGKLLRNLDEESLRETLESLLETREGRRFAFAFRR